MATYYHSKNSKLQIAPVGSTTYTTLAIKSATFTGKSAKQDTTSTISGGYMEFQAGLQNMDVEFTAQWDSVLEPYATPPALIEGTFVLYKFFALGSSTVATFSGELFIEEVPVKHAIADIIEYSVKGTSTGSYTAA